jgi:Uma2 family endonuclease
MTDYALHGVQEYWIVDTEQEAIEQYVLEGNTFRLAQKLKDGLLTAEAIPGFGIRVKDVFAE